MSLLFEKAAYRLEVVPDGLKAALSLPGEGAVAWLRPLAALDTTDGPDETLAVSVRRTGEDELVVERRSTRWEHAAATLTCRDDGIDLRTRVRGHGELTDVHLLAGRSLIAGGHLGFLPSGSAFRTLYSPGPVDPEQPLRSAAEAATTGVLGDSEPGRRRWLFTPAPFFFALRASDEGTWTSLALTAPVEALSFVQLAYVPSEGGFWLRLEYEGHTRVDGEWEAPLLSIRVGSRDPHEALRLVAEPVERSTPAWWSEPIFCGWGAQCRRAAESGGRAADHATQHEYDSFLERLEREGVVPGTVVLDDKWQATYGANEPDTAKWPDLRGWIARRHAAGQRVLLWWKAWDPEGLPPELCVRNPGAQPVAVDPSNPQTRAYLAEMTQRLLAPDGLDADGLKIDFTARTPSGRALSHHGPGWGVALLHLLLETVYEAAKAAKAEALVITHTPHPGFVDVTDMIRLNDMTAGTPVPAQMHERAEVVRAVCPGLLVDTDDWRVPNLEEWRAYLRLKPTLGVPALYYADGLDASGEDFTPADYELLRKTWAGWRSGR